MTPDFNFQVAPWAPRFVFARTFLLSRLEKLVRTERKIIHLVLECIVEIGRRKIYLQQAYPSLFEFLTTKYGHSAGAAMRRIEGARLLKQLPEIASKLEDGSLNLSQLAKAAQSFRHVEKSQRLSSAAKFEILQKIESKTAQETEVILGRELQIESIIHLVHNEIAKRTLIQKKSPLPKPNTNPRQLRPSDRQRLMQNSCCYRDPETGRICGTKYFRQADHIHSVCLGGSREPENLQTLWVQHNSWKFHGRGSVTEVQSLEHAP